MFVLVRLCPSFCLGCHEGLIVNTNSPGCVLYAIGVAYGMGKCAVDKMTADTAMELATEGIDVMSWWPGVPMRSEEILQGAVDGGSPRRGLAPGLQLVPPFRSLYHTALATTLRFEGRALAALARDRAGRTRPRGGSPLPTPRTLGASRGSPLRREALGVSTMSAGVEKAGSQSNMGRQARDREPASLPRAEARARRRG